MERQLSELRRTLGMDESDPVERVLQAANDTITTLRGELPPMQRLKEVAIRQATASAAIDRLLSEATSEGKVSLPLEGQRGELLDKLLLQMSYSEITWHALCRELLDE